MYLLYLIRFVQRLSVSPLIDLNWWLYNYNNYIKDHVHSFVSCSDSKSESQQALKVVLKDIYEYSLDLTVCFIHFLHGIP